MTTYNLKKDAKVYLVYGNARYTLDVTEEISFSQTFTDQTYSTKTLHNMNNLFEQSNIKKANPANFEITVPALVENDLLIVSNLLIDNDTVGGHSLKQFDLYIETASLVYRLESCVITNGTFIIEKLENLKLQIQGEAVKLSTQSFVPGSYHGLTIITRSATREFMKIDYLEVSLGGADITDGLYSLSIELQNDVKWTPYTTVHGALDVTNASTSMYPSNFTLEKRSLAGSIKRYVKSDNKADLQTWKTDQALVIKAGKTQFKGFQFNLPACTFTNRNMVEEAFSQSYDWKLNSNVTDLGSNLIRINNN